MVALAFSPNFWVLERVSSDLSPASTASFLTFPLLHCDLLESVLQQALSNCGTAIAIGAVCCMCLSEQMTSRHLHAPKQCNMREIVGRSICEQYLGVAQAECTN